MMLNYDRDKVPIPILSDSQLEKIRFVADEIESCQVRGFDIYFSSLEGGDSNQLSQLKQQQVRSLAGHMAGLLNHIKDDINPEYLTRVRWDIDVFSNYQPNLSSHWRRQPNYEVVNREIQNFHIEEVHWRFGRLESLMTDIGNDQRLTKDPKTRSFKFDQIDLLLNQIRTLIGRTGIYDNDQIRGIVSGQIYRRFDRLENLMTEIDNNQKLTQNLDLDSLDAWFIRFRQVDLLINQIRVLIDMSGLYDDNQISQTLTDIVSRSQTLLNNPGAYSSRPELFLATNIETDLESAVAGNGFDDETVFNLQVDQIKTLIDKMENNQLTLQDFLEASRKLEINPSQLLGKLLPMLDWDQDRSGPSDSTIQSFESVATDGPGHQAGTEQIGVDEVSRGAWRTGY